MIFHKLFIYILLVKINISYMINPTCVQKEKYGYANILDPEKPPSKSAAGQSSNLFATQSIIPNQKRADV